MKFFARLCFACAFLMVALRFGYQGPARPLPRLEARLAEVERMDNVAQRAHVVDFYRLVDGYLTAGRRSDALAVLVRALALNPGNGIRQLQAAELEIETGRRDAAHARLGGILSGRGDESVLARARALAERLRASGHQPRAARPPAKTEHVLAFLAFEGVDRALVEALAERAGTAFGVRTVVLDAAPKPDGDGARDAGWSPTGVQLEADRLVRQVATFRPARTVGVVGVTAMDLYAGNLNFLFGSAQEGAGVMSLARFDERGLPREALLARATKQAFSTTGFVLGVPRCSTAACARAYPHSLEELERKGHSLCGECMDRVDRVLGRVP
jgi:predicted Zn-dependent protease